MLVKEHGSRLRAELHFWYIKHLEWLSIIKLLSSRWFNIDDKNKKDGIWGDNSPNSKSCKSIGGSSLSALWLWSNSDLEPQGNLARVARDDVASCKFQNQEH